jgi:hypothetical protein
MQQSYRDKEKGYSRSKTVESFGYLDELQKIYCDPIEHFKKVVEQKNIEEQLEAAEYTIIAKKKQALDKNTSNRMNYGYIIILKIFYELGIDRFLVNRQRTTKIKYNTSTIMKLLVISRILSPGSKKKAFDERERYFDFDKTIGFDLIDIYRSLSHFAKLATDIQLLMHDRITKNYGRKTDLIYYDVTNYYFEIDKEDELKLKGYSKEHRPDPIVQMGLAMDGEGLPISYEIFPGNESEKLHLRPMVLELCEKYDGYYSIVTNVFNEGKDKGKFDDDKIIEIYRGLWQIEDSFRVTKHELETRPIFLSRNDRIQAHFLICYIALVIIRLIQKMTEFLHSPAKLIEAMNNISCSNESANIYLFDYRSDVSDDLGQALGFDFTRLRLTRAEIKKNLGAAKKS